MRWNFQGSSPSWPAAIFNSAGYTIGMPCLRFCRTWRPVNPPPRLLLIPLSPTTSLRNTGRVRTTQEKENEGTCTTHASSQQRQHNRGDGRQSIYYGVVQYSLWYLVPVEVCYPDLTPGRPTTCIPTSLRNTSQR